MSLFGSELLPAAKQDLTFVQLFVSLSFNEDGCTINTMLITA